jgi:stage II sporulation protein D (peptidoglycan lytic transglycosylase)
MRFVAVVVFVVPVLAHAQGDVTDSQLIAASAGRVVRVGPPSGSRGPITSVPLEVYVARVLAGEGEPDAADAARQALAVAIRTYALANAARHGRDGFDVCDSTHCQVLRASTVATRRATLATAGRILSFNNRPAQLFYSASCGGYSESPDEVWPGAEYPYLRVAADDVHQNDPPWTLTLTLEEIERALTRAGFAGRLRGIRVEARNASGRASRLELAGLRPGSIAGDQFRAAVGFVTVRSTAFSIETSGNIVRFTGRGFGHGVGMCVIGAGRRAARGDTMEAILAQYYPGLELTPLSAALGPSGSPEPAAETVNGSRGGRSPILVRVASSAKVTANEIERMAMIAHADLAQALGVSIAPVTVRVHESLDSFRAATGRPWWISSVAEGTEIELVPMALLAQRDGVETTLRRSMAELFVAEALRGRPAWIRVGAARFFARRPAAPATGHDGPPTPRCPADAELTFAVSAPAQREAEARAEACFAREYAQQHDWRAIR